MGWSTICILVNEREHGCLGSFPQHDSLAAHALVEKLGLGPVRTSLCQILMPDSVRKLVGYALERILVPLYWLESLTWLAVLRTPTIHCSQNCLKRIHA